MGERIKELWMKEDWGSVWLGIVVMPLIETERRYHGR